MNTNNNLEACAEKIQETASAMDDALKLMAIKKKWASIREEQDKVNDQYQKQLDDLLEENREFLIRMHILTQ